MKNLFFTSFLASLFFISCSSDDNSDSGTVLYKTEQTTIMKDTLITSYEGGFKTRVDMRGGFFRSFTYNSSGQLISETELPNVDLNYNYDSEGRLKYIETLITGSDRDFIYNDETNTVTENNSTYYFNNGGKIYKQRTLNNNGSLIDYTINYAEGLPASIEKTITNYDSGVLTSTATVTTTFEYDNDHDPALLGINQDVFDTNRALIEKSVYPKYLDSFITKKYITQVNEGGVITKYLYTFNSKGLPTEVKTELDGTIISTTKFFYR